MMHATYKHIFNNFFQKTFHTQEAYFIVQFLCEQYIYEKTDGAETF